MMQEVFLTPVEEKEVTLTPIVERKPSKPADWRKELIGGLLYKAARRGYDTATGKYYEPMTKRKYWAETAETLARQAGQFFHAVTGIPGEDAYEQEMAREAYLKAKVAEKKPTTAQALGIAGVEMGKMGLEFAKFLPETAGKFALDPVKTIHDDTLAVIFLTGVAGRGIISKWRAKAKAGQPITKQNVVEVVDKIPETVLTKEQKVGVKAKLPEKIKVPPEKLEPSPQYSKILYRGVSGKRRVLEGTYGKGEYWTTDRGYASTYAVGGELLEKQITLKKPFIVQKTARNIVEKMGDEAWHKAKDAGKSVAEADSAAASSIRKQLVSKGYDGIVLKEPGGAEVVVFHPEKAVGKLEPPVAGGLARGMEIPEAIAGVRLDKLNAPYDVKLELANLAGSMMKELKQKKVSWKETEALANKAGITVESLKWAKEGEAFNAAKLEATRKTVGASVADTLERHKVYIDNPSDANLIAFRGALERSGMILRTLREKKAQAGRALNILKKEYEPGEVKYQFFERVLKELGGREKNLEIVEKFKRLDLDNPVSVNKFLRDITKPKLSDKIFEVWVNSILSGPVTQMRNIVSNAFMLVDKPVTSLGAALVEAPRRLTGKKPSVYFGESPHAMFGALSGLKQGVKKALFAWQNEMTMEGAMKLEMRHPAAIKGAVGKKVRIPGRGLIAMDEFFKAILNESDIHSLAYRMASKERLKGKAKVNRIAGLIHDPPTEMILHATGERLARTFQLELGKWGKGVYQLRESIYPSRYILPFIRTPINIPKQAFYRSPLNLPRIMLLAAQGKLKGAPLAEQIAMAGMGTLTSIGIFMLAKEGLVTGTPPTDKNEREAFYREGKQPWSIKIGKKWYSYAGVEPLATLLGITADSADIWEKATSGELDNLASKIIMSVTQNMMNKTFLYGATMFLQAVTDPDRGGERWLGGITGSMIPTAAAQAAAAKDPYLRDARTIIDSVKARIPIVRETLPLKRDVWGRPIKREGAAAYRLISPVYLKTEEPTALDNELKRLKLFIGQPSRRVGKKKLTPEDYSVMSQQIGETLFKVLNGLVKQPYYQQASDEEKKKKIRSVVQQVRKIGRMPYYRPTK